MPNFKSVSQIVSEIWTIQYFGSHLGIEISATWSPKFINFVFGSQGDSMPNFKSVAQILSEILQRGKSPHKYYKVTCSQIIPTSHFFFLFLDSTSAVSPNIFYGSTKGKMLKLSSMLQPEGFLFPSDRKFLIVFTEE